MNLPLRSSSKIELEQRFLDYLFGNDLIDKNSRKRVVAALQASGQSIQTILLELGIIEEGRLAQAIAEYLGLESATVQDFSFETSTELAVPRDFLHRTSMLPLAYSDHDITIAVSQPFDAAPADALAYSLGRTAVIKVALASELSRFLNILSDEISGTEEPDNYSDASSSDVERLRDIASEAPIIRLLNRLIGAAVEKNASDIHIELLEDHVRVRLRVDGALQIVEQLDRNLHLGLISRIKILARLNIAEQRLPQDGRIKLAVKGREIDLRVATAPTLNGENVVLRILDRNGIDLDLSSLGFSIDAVQKLKRILSVPNGVVLVTGPTGSGKTTTLYAALNGLNEDHSKLFTVEDPIEYQLKGISQIPVKPQIGLDFAAILRSILRQDPDIIMVGEIRDGETAKIAMQASLTGHLVLSTLHTNSAATSITRLRHMGIEDFLIASSVRAIVAQRLVRKNCSHDGQGESQRRCGQCHGTGYAGRTVIYEILEFTVEVREAILAGGTDMQIEHIALRQGMVSLRQSGRRKVSERLTSEVEVTRAIGIDNQ
jgi:general secretion pathway protein E